MPFLNNDMRNTFDNLKYFYCVLLILGFFSCKIGPKTYAQPSEPHRPHFHFTPPEKWMNDPNGMVYYDGEYHLFYQHYPKATVWGPMHWGHAVSTDLVHWQHLPIALYPDSLGLIFSGSAVIDWKNTTGFGKNGQPPMVAIFTHHLMEGEKAGRTDFQYQSIAYSNDKGRTWTKYSGNPVVPNTQKIKDFRDPKVIWHEPSQAWIMVFAAQNQVKIWRSKDLKSWEHQSDFGTNWGTHAGVWECPDLFPLLDQTGRQKWVLLVSINPGGPNGGSATQYFIGDFDGKNFIPDPLFSVQIKNENAVWLDWGRDNYAGVTWSDIPAKDGRRLFMGWMSNWDYATVVPTEKWRSATTLPRELSLKNTEKGVRLAAQPAKELEKLRKKTLVFENIVVEKELDLVKKSGISASEMEIVMDVEIPETGVKDIAVVLSNAQGEEYRIGYEPANNRFFSDRTKSGKTLFSDKFASKKHYASRISTSKSLQLHLYFDAASCELFADSGEVVMTDIFFPTSDFTKARVVISGNAGVVIKSAKIWGLNKN